MSIRIEFNSDGFAALLKSDEVKGMIEGHTDAIKQKADNYVTGETAGFKGDVKLMGTRWVGLVGTTDMATMIAESEQKALTKAVNG